MNGRSTPVVTVPTIYITRSPSDINSALRGQHLSVGQVNAAHCTITAEIDALMGMLRSLGDQPPRDYLERVLRSRPTQEKPALYILDEGARSPSSHVVEIWYHA